jgi:hypothetical protein
VTLQLFSDWTAAHAWALVLAFPAPGQLQAAGKRRWEKLLYTHRVSRPETVGTPLQLIAHAQALPASPAVVRAKSLRAVSIATKVHEISGLVHKGREEMPNLAAARESSPA